MTVNYRLFDFKKFTSATTDSTLDTAIQTAASKTTSASLLGTEEKLFECFFVKIMTAASHIMDIVIKKDLIL